MIGAAAPHQRVRASERPHRRGKRPRAGVTAAAVHHNRRRINAAAGRAVVGRIKSDSGRRRWGVQSNQRGGSEQGAQDFSHRLELV